MKYRTTMGPNEKPLRLIRPSCWRGLSDGVADHLKYYTGPDDSRYHTLQDTPRNADDALF